ncbi:MAG: 4Fe-4S cluster-binding domain-containing protein, partial [Oscillospiraceae bacterium]|nr:4Fe-4S cluster-binding domain-containing protein [Oscillospiraceae bacterium]
MIVAGLQKLTLLDYPGQVACTVFTGGCNFRCPFCHNAALVLPELRGDAEDAEAALD